MNRLFKIGLLIVFFGSLFLGCHKYPDDPFISLRSPSKRITKYQWHLNKLLVNGQDSISLFHDNVGRPLDVLEWLHVDEHNNFILNDEFGTGTWSIGNKLTIYYTGISGNLNYHLSPDGYTTWDIIELYEKTLIIRRITNGKTYEAYFNGLGVPH